MNSPSERKANCFDALRLLAALCVLVSHMVEHLQVSFFWLHEGNGHSYWFYDGVPLFFIISGFLVYRSYEKCHDTGHPSLDYFLNRYLRIAPALYAYTFLTIALALAVDAISPTALWSKTLWGWVLLDMLLIPITTPVELRGFGVGVINGPLWTITAEVGFYMVVPLIHGLRRLIGWPGMLVSLAALSIGGLLLMAWEISNAPSSMFAKLLHVSFVPYLIFFGWGIFWSHAWKRVPQLPSLGIGSLLVYAAIRVVGVGHIPVDSLNPAYVLVWSGCLSYGAIWAAYHGPTLLRTVTERIGDLSYGIYIWHMVIINLALYLNLSSRLPAGLTQVFVIAMTIALAAASWWLIERPCLRLKRYSSRQTPIPGSDVRAAKAG